jgi:hypothetical protein
VIIRGSTALWLYSYFMQLGARGPASEKAFSILRAELKLALDEARIDTSRV